MIINVHGESSGDLRLEMPNIFIDRKLKFQVGVHRIHYELDDFQIDQGANNELLSLCSNLVDRSAVNPSQSILLFNFKTKGGSKQSCKINNVIFYDLNLHEIQNASFKILLYNGESIFFPIKSIFLQIEIKRADSYGRV